MNPRHGATPLDTVISAPTPSGVVASWYPAAVKLPAVDRPWSRTKVYATPEGLYVYVAAGDDGLAWHSPIHFAATSRPRPTSHTARTGHAVETDAGTVVITKENGCGCGWPLKRWNPGWAGVRLAWPS